MKRYALWMSLAAAIALQPVVARAADAPGGDKADDAKSDTESESGREDRLQDRSRALGDRIKSVQRKAFLKRNRHELGVNLGVTLNDAFLYSFTAGGNYTYHIRESFALGVDARYFFANTKTDAYRIIRATQVAVEPQIFSPLLTLSGEAQFSPIYGKMSLMSEKIVHYDVYVAAGFGAVMTDATSSPWSLLGSVAIGARIVTLDWLTIKIEVRDQIFSARRSNALNESSVQNLLTFNLGVSFFLPPSFDYRYE